MIGLSIINRYLFKELLGPFITSLLTFSTIMLMGRTLKLSDLVVNKGLSIIDILKLISYIFIPFLGYIIPMSGAADMHEVEKCQPVSLYQITIQGTLGTNLSHWFDSLSVTSPVNSDITILSGEIPDQPKLRGILNTLWDLNLSIISVIKLKD